ncbi:MAG: MBOAT family protein [Bacteroidia bacterium]|nr:MBOAT family protein [Bacteroidia bacterium]
MLFNSFEFLIFFPVVTLLYFLLPHKFRWLLLLIASCGFYMAFVPKYIIILGFTIVVDYIAGILIEQSEGRKKKLLLTASIIANVGVLAVFKYFNFINENLTTLVQSFGIENPVPFLKFALPIGLSFHTFQAMSYTIEVYRGNQKAEKHFGIYSLYVMFYPQLVAGPIERPQNILHQFYEKHQFSYRNAADGLKLVAWGLFKKVVIADRLAQLVNQVYNNPDQYQGIPIVIAVIFFSYQIYCDFSGYTDIALGCSQVMGFKLVKNFNRPYAATSINEFWSRWHISLSSWFRDYFYIPLGGNRLGIPRWYLNLFLVFIVSGLWHGAAWTFIAWGALHGLYTVMSRATKTARKKYSVTIGLDSKPKLDKFLSTIFVFIIVSIAWVFFRAPSFSSAWQVLQGLFKGWGNYTSIKAIKDSLGNLGMEKPDILFGFGLIIFLEWVQRFQINGSIRNIISEKPTVVRWAIYYGVVVAIILFGVFNQSKFIYFQF